MKKKPAYLLQQGGVVPIQTAVMQGASMAPIVQTAAMPIDSGVGVALNLRQQNIALKELDLKKDQLAWQKEKWNQEMELTKRGLDMQEFQAIIKISDYLSSSGAPTGVSKSASAATGIPTNAHTLAQSKIMQDLNVQRQELINSSMKNIFAEGQFDRQAAFGVLDVKEKIQDIEENSDYGKAMSQMTRYQQQMDLYAKDPEKYDKDVYLNRLNEYYNGNLDYNKSLLVEDINPYMDDIAEQLKDKYGPVQAVQMEDGTMVLQQVNVASDPNQIVAITNDIKHEFAGTIQAKYEQFYNQMRDAGYEKSEIADYETWANNYIVNGIVTRMPQDVKYNAKIDSKGTINIKAGFNGQYLDYANPIHAGDYSGDAGMAMRKFNLKEDYSIKENSSEDISNMDPRSQWLKKNGWYLPNPDSFIARMVTTGINLYWGTKIQRRDIEKELGLNPEGNRRLIDDDFSVWAFEQATKTYKPGEDLTDYAVSASVKGKKTYLLSDEAIAYTKDYLELLDKTISDNPTVYGYIDEKSKKEVRSRVNSMLASDVVVMDKSGNIINSEQFAEMFRTDPEKKDTYIPIEDLNITIVGEVDENNNLPLIAQMGNQVSDPDQFAMSTVIEITPKKGEPVRLYVPASKDRQLTNPSGVSGTKLYNLASRHVGLPAAVEGSFKTDIKNTMRGANIDASTMDRITENVTHVSRPQGTSHLSAQMAGAVPSSIEVVESSRLGQGLVLADQISNTLNPSQHVSVKQRISGGQTAWEVKVDDNDPIYLPGKPTPTQINAIGARSYSKEGFTDMRTYGKIADNPYIAYDFSANPTMNTNLNKGFLQEFENQLLDSIPESVLEHKLFPSSGTRKPGANKTSQHIDGMALDFRDTIGMELWVESLFTNEMGINTFKKSKGKEFVINKIPGTDFTLTYHGNQDPSTGEYTGGYHYHLAYKK